MSRLFMNPKIQSWNLRGLNKGDKYLRVRHLLKVEGGCGLFVGNQVGACVLQSCAANMWNSVCLNSRGASIRIMLMWDRRVVEKFEECVGELL